MFYWHVFTHLLRKCFTGNFSAKTPQIHNLWGGKMAFIYPENGMDKKLLKIVLWGPLNNEMAKTVTLGSAYPPTVTNLAGAKMAFIYPENGMNKNCSKTSVGVH